MRIVRALAVIIAISLAVSPLMGGCEGDDGNAGAPGGTGATGASGTPQPTDTILDLSEDMPGFVLNIVSLSGGTGTGGNFQSGDTISVNFTIKKNDGSSLPINEADGMAMWMSGPTTNYQHILPAGNSFYYTDMKTAAVQQADGSYAYTFPAVIPATYGPPYYDTTKFTAGELTGQALQAGTYTVAFRGYKNYTDVNGTTYRDVGWNTKDFLFGSAITIASREVVKDANCNTCHVSIQFHGGTYRSTKLCITCHTSGAEDRYSDTMGAGDTTNVTIDFRVMIHKIHNGKHLPSVVGVTTDAAGVRQYGTGTPYKVGGSGYAGSTIYDFSEIAFPAFPNMSIGMPRDTGYSGLAAGAKTQEDEILKGVTNCEKCHGDPDGAGSQTAPAQGTQAYTAPTRRACGSCHDDVNWAATYSSNGLTMPVQTDDDACAVCHVGSNNTLDTILAHQHPIYRKSAVGAMTFVNPGMKITLTSVTEPSGDGNGNDNGIVEQGEKIQIVFTLTDELTPASNLDLSADTTASLSLVVSGPTSNYNLLLNGSFPRALITGAASYTSNIPETVYNEVLGDSTAAGGETWTSSRAPHWTATGTTTTVYLYTVTGGGGSSTLSAAPNLMRNYVDVVSSLNFARGDYVLIDAGASREICQIQYVDGNRLWFGSGYGASYGWIKKAHLVGATVVEMTQATVPAGSYTLTVAIGNVLETTEFGTGVVAATYTSDFLVPADYPSALNSSPDLDETWGKWEGKPLVEGTYSVGLWGMRNVFITSAGALGADGTGDNTTYRSVAKAAKKDFLIGTTETEIEAYGLISSGSNCDACHNDLMFHGGGRRSFDACVMCHGTAGAEDRPRYVAGNASLTTGQTVNFRTMLHKIHMGAELWNASTYVVNGYGYGAYPNNFTGHMYDEVVFPSWPGEAKHCDKCHGTSNTAWQEPSDRAHPTTQTLPMRRWRPVCLSCHDSPDAQGHYELNTSPSGYESCGACHDPNSIYQVKVVHKNR